MRALITGASGFVGQWLARRLLAAGHEVWGAARHVPERLAILDPAEMAAVRWEACDLEDPAAIARLLGLFRPQAVYHLAAQSNPHASHDDPAGTFRANVIGTIHLLQGLRATSGAEPPRTLLIGSGQMYGRVGPEALPIKETAPLDPVNPYSVSKVAQELVGRQYWQAYGLPVIMTRSFNHTGPGQDERYAISHFAASLARIALGQAPPQLAVGNLAARRDYVDVRDVAEAYEALIARGRPGEAYNVCSGRTSSMQQILDQLVRLSGVEVEVRVDEKRLRSVDEPVLQGDGTKIARETGWRPRIPLEQTLQDMLDYHRDRLQRSVVSSR